MPSNRYGFISLGRDSLKLKTKQESCLALVSVSHDRLGFFCLDEILLLGYDSKNVAEQTIKFNVRQVGIDTDNYEWLIDGWNNEINKAYQHRPDRRGKLPLLKVYQRDTDIAVRQLSVVEDLLVSKTLSIATHLQQNPNISSLITAWGVSLVADAVTGALLVAKEQAKLIEQKLAKQVQLSQEPPTWLDMPRVGY